MDWFVPVMLAAQAGLLLAVVYALGVERPSANRPAPRYLSIGFSLLVSAMVSWEIADRHAAAGGAAVLRYGAALLMGMAIVMLLLDLRRRRGLESGKV